jgi:exonuclease III
MAYRVRVKARWFLALAASIAVAKACGSCHARSPELVFATFNIEDFPKTDRQAQGAFETIAATHASFVAVQEIVEPALFAREAKTRLGKNWEFVSTNIGERAQPYHELGVLYDADVWAPIATAVHEDTRLEDGRGKPTFEVQLRRGDFVVRVFVVHLKAGGDGRAMRARQYAALGRLLARTTRAAEHVIVLGDFNSTDDTGDRGDLAALAAHADLTWASEPLACSSFWDRDDGCFRARLDHVVMWTHPARVVAGGACATEGCDRQDSCPLYADDVSDHCPVVVTLD